MPWEISIINGCTKLNQPFIQSVGDGSHAFIYQNLCFTVSPLKINYVSLSRGFETVSIRQQLVIAYSF